MKKVVLFALLMAVVLSGCATDADIASRNLSYEAEQFRIVRRIIVVNGITDTVAFVVEGRCSIEEDENRRLETTCKIGPNEYIKNFVGRSDNVFYLLEQLETADVSTYRYKRLVKPATAIPDIEIDIGGK